MPIIATPEVGIPLPFDTTPEEIESFREKAHAYFKTIEALTKQGLEIDITQQDKMESHQIMASKKLPLAKNLTSGTILNLEAILTEWDQEVLDVNRRLRNYTTNKLIVESVDPDPKQRMRALENLGRIGAVGLFSEKIDVTVTHRTVIDIESELRKTLALYGSPIVDVEVKETPKSIDDIDLDEELGRVDGSKTSD
jgi:hypothetical protein